MSPRPCCLTTPLQLTLFLFLAARSVLTLRLTRYLGPVARMRLQQLFSRMRIHAKWHHRNVQRLRISIQG